MSALIKGPYKPEGRLVFGPDGRDIGYVYGDIEDPRTEATARLFAASWDMLQALKFAEAFIAEELENRALGGDHEDNPSYLSEPLERKQFLCLAILKAEGRNK